jgi:hypothetical protein
MPKICNFLGLENAEPTSHAGAVTRSNMDKENTVCSNFFGSYFNDTKSSRKLLICRHFHTNDHIEKTICKIISLTQIICKQHCWQETA